MNLSNCTKIFQKDFYMYNKIFTQLIHLLHVGTAIYQYFLFEYWIWQSDESSVLKTSSKTLTSRPGATEERIVDRALTEQRVTPGAPRIIPEHPEDRKSYRSTTKEHRSKRSTTEQNGAFVFLYDLFFIPKLSINR